MPMTEPAKASNGCIRAADQKVKQNPHEGSDGWNEPGTYIDCGIGRLGRHDGAKPRSELLLSPRLLHY